MAKKFTIESLAAMSQREFAAIHDELRSFREEVRDSFKLLRADLREIKIVLPATVRAVGEMQDEFEELRGRVDRIEKKVGLSK